MSNLNSSVLILNHPQPQAVDFGADVVTSPALMLAAIAQHNYQVVAISLDSLDAQDLKDLLSGIHAQIPLAQRIYISAHPNLDSLQTCLQMGPAFKILANWDEPVFSQTLHEALSEYALTQQNQELLQLVRDQHAQLQRLNLELEDRVKKREAYLRATHQRLVHTSRRIEALHYTLMAIHRAETVADMEQKIHQAVKKAMSVEWTRIIFPHQSHIENEESVSKVNFTILSIPLLKNHERIGQIYFARAPTSTFSQGEEQFLLQVSNTVALAIDRLHQLENAESITHQWEGTFDAISTPVSLVDEQYNIVRANRAFALRAGGSVAAVIGQKCYKVFFSRDIPCEGCWLNETFRITHVEPNGTGEVETIDVKSQILPPQDQHKRYYVNFYKNVSDQLRLQRQIVQSAKMAELGTIGSSIAHELNNPLAGLLSFIQIIKMDMTGEEAYAEDIREMEHGARRCKEIVQNLLDFSRQSHSDEKTKIDLREVVTQSIKISEIQTRSRGIVIHSSLPNAPVSIRGNAIQLTQALRNLLQNANEAIHSRRLEERDFNGRIEVNLFSQPQKAEVVVDDNGIGIAPDQLRRVFNPMFTTKDPHLNPGLGLTIARQIVAEHGGSLEITSQPGRRTRAILSLPRLYDLD